MNFNKKFLGNLRGDHSSASKTPNNLDNDASHKVEGNTQKQSEDKGNPQKKSGDEGNPSKQSEVDYGIVAIDDDDISEDLSIADFEKLFELDSESSSSSSIEIIHLNVDEDSNQIIAFTDSDKKSQSTDEEFSIIKAESDNNKVSKVKYWDNWNEVVDHVGKVDGQQSAMLSSFEKLRTNNMRNPFYLNSFYETSKSITSPRQCNITKHYDDSDSSSSIEVIKEGYRSSTDEEDA